MFRQVLKALPVDFLQVSFALGLILEHLV
jgi:hypothetical protein